MLGAGGTRGYGTRVTDPSANLTSTIVIPRMVCSLRPPAGDATVRFPARERPPGGGVGDVTASEGGSAAVAVPG